MKTLSLSFSSLVAFCICFTVSAAETNTNRLLGQPAQQVTIKAKVNESKGSESILIKFSCPTVEGSLDFLDGVFFIPKLFTVTNTQQSIDATNLHKMNKKKTKVIFKTKCHTEINIIALIVNNGMFTGKIKSRSKTQSSVLELLGLPLLPTNGQQTKKLFCQINALNKILAECESNIKYSVSPKKVAQIKPQGVKSTD